MRIKMYFSRKSLPGLLLSNQSISSGGIMIQGKTGDQTDGDTSESGTRPRPQGRRSNSSPKPQTSWSSTSKVKVHVMIYLIAKYVVFSIVYIADIVLYTVMTYFT